MHELAPLISDLAIMLMVAGVVVLIFQRIQQPVVLGYLVAGMIIGPYTPPYAFISDETNIKIISELGVIFLMFSLGLEFSFHKLTKVGFSALITGVIDVSMMVIVGYFAGEWLGWNYHDRLFLGAAIAISSTTIIIKATSELNLKTKRFAEVIFGVLIVEDLLAILLLVGLSTTIHANSIFSIDILLAAAKLILVVGFWFLAGYFLVPPFFRKVAPYISQETLTVASIGFCLFLVVVANHFHYSTALGAFIMGSILAETVLVHRIETVIVPIRDIFGAVFFISVGMLINPAVIMEQWQAVLFISLVLVVGKVTVISLGTFLTGQSLNTAIRSGFSMAQIGEFSFIIATLGLSLGVINDKLYPIIVAVSGITTFTTPYMIRLSGHISKFAQRSIPERVKFFLDSYTAWVFRAQTNSQNNPWVGSVTMRLLANGILVAIIFLCVKTYVYPEILPLVDNKRDAKLICELVAILLSSPFIWGMLFSFRHVKIPDYAKTVWSPIVFGVWFLTLAEVLFLSIVNFHTWLTTAIFMVLVIIFFFVSYRHLERSYHWFERQLVGNIGPKPARKSRYQDLAPWETHFVEMDVGWKSPFVNKTMGDAQIRQRYGVNIVAIHRGPNIILAPRGEEVILTGDKLIVLGNDEQIEEFRKWVTKTAPIIQEQAETPGDFVLKPLLLGVDHPFVGKTIRTSRIREQVQGLVVGLERGNTRILNPDPDTVLMADDLVMLVGVSDKMTLSV
ncbi:MAG TPA: cation:proton antiporter [Gammaproteobacteria bacterium]|nr:cation:proton antiporter [Gammaproteobacteria bacterium]